MSIRYIHAAAALLYLLFFGVFWRAGLPTALPTASEVENVAHRALMGDNGAVRREVPARRQETAIMRVVRQEQREQA